MNAAQRLFFLPVMLALKAVLVLIFAGCCVHAVWQWLTGKVQ